MKQKIKIRSQILSKSANIYKMLVLIKKEKEGIDITMSDLMGNVLDEYAEKISLNDLKIK